MVDLEYVKNSLENTITKCNDRYDILNKSIDSLIDILSNTKNKLANNETQVCMDEMNDQIEKLDLHEVVQSKHQCYHSDVSKLRNSVNKVFNINLYKGTEDLPNIPNNIIHCLISHHFLYYNNDILYNIYKKELNMKNIIPQELVDRYINKKEVLSGNSIEGDVQKALKWCLSRNSKKKYFNVIFDLHRVQFLIKLLEGPSVAIEYVKSNMKEYFPTKIAEINKLISASAFLGLESSPYSTSLAAEWNIVKKSFNRMFCEGSCKWVKSEVSIPEEIIEKEEVKENEKMETIMLPELPVFYRTYTNRSSGIRDLDNQEIILTSSRATLHGARLEEWHTDEETGDSSRSSVHTLPDAIRLSAPPIISCSEDQSAINEEIIGGGEEQEEEADGKEYSKDMLEWSRGVHNYMERMKINKKRVYQQHNPPIIIKSGFRGDPIRYSARGVYKKDLRNLLKDSVWDSEQFLRKFLKKKRKITNDTTLEVSTSRHMTDEAMEAGDLSQNIVSTLTIAASTPLTTVTDINQTVDPTTVTNINPTVAPTIDINIDQTVAPTIETDIDPTVDPTQNSTVAPTRGPTIASTRHPTIAPARNPTIAPTIDTTAPTPLVSLLQWEATFEELIRINRLGISNNNERLVIDAVTRIPVSSTSAELSSRALNRSLADTFILPSFVHPSLREEFIERFTRLVENIGMFRIQQLGRHRLGLLLDMAEMMVTQTHVNRERPHRHRGQRLHYIFGINRSSDGEHEWIQQGDVIPSRYRQFTQNNNINNNFNNINNYMNNLQIATPVRLLQTEWNESDLNYAFPQPLDEMDIGEIPHLGEIPPLGEIPSLGDTPPSGETPPLGETPPSGDTAHSGETPPQSLDNESFEEENIGIPNESPLCVLISAGLASIPKLFLLSETGVVKKKDESLPLEIDLGRQFAFHSSVSCPVSRRLASSSDRPVLFPCGHSILRSTMERIARTRLSRFRCPVCPQFLTSNEALELRLTR
eukprot:GHVL01006720.1.p1 GENE.GHVL01006720.1~~GHVL01006720.1.p1  ORF type:complete len:985 (+),score=219.23 GHVL01006720.1:62-3016(+)